MLQRRMLIGSGTAAWCLGAARLQAAGNAAPAPAYQVPTLGSLPYRPFEARAADGVRIAAQEWGNPAGPEIVFIHGVLQSHLSFARQVAGSLAEEFRLVTYDLRGHGASEKPPGPESYLDDRRWADDLRAVIDAAGMKRPALVAWSMGGLVVANYLKVHGDGGLAGINFVDAFLSCSPDFAGDPATRSYTTPRDTTSWRR